MVSLPPCKFEPENRENKAQCVPVFKELTKSIFFLPLCLACIIFGPPILKLVSRKVTGNGPYPAHQHFCNEWGRSPRAKGQLLDKRKMNLFSLSLYCLNHLKQTDLDFVTGK